MQCFQEDQVPAGVPPHTLLRIVGCIPAFFTRGKGASGPFLSAPVGASKRETPTSNLTESTAMTQSDFYFHCHVYVSLWLVYINFEWTVLAVCQAVTCSTVAGMLAVSLRVVQCKLLQIFVPLRVSRTRCCYFLASGKENNNTKLVSVHFKW